MSYRGIIRSFRLKGRARENNVKLTYEHYILNMAFDEGYVPVLELEPYYDVKYNFDMNDYEVEMVIQTAYYGEGARECKGLLYGLPIEKYSQKERPPESLMD